VAKGGESMTALANCADSPGHSTGGGYPGGWSLVRLLSCKDAESPGRSQDAEPEKARAAKKSLSKALTCTNM
jgi:hypothetical protein